MKGRGGFSWYMPCTISASAKFTPHARTRISTSSGPGSGSGTSATTSASGGPHSLQTTALTIQAPVSNAPTRRYRPPSPVRTRRAGITASR